MRCARLPTMTSNSQGAHAVQLLILVLILCSMPAVAKEQILARDVGTYGSHNVEPDSSNAKPAVTIWDYERASRTPGETALGGLNRSERLSVPGHLNSHAPHQSYMFDDKEGSESIRYWRKR